MFGVSGRRDGFESPGTTRGSFERSASEDQKRGWKNEDSEEGSESSGVGIRFEAAAETGLRMELRMGGSRESGGEELGSARGCFPGEPGDAGEGRDSTPHGGGRGTVGRQAAKRPKSS